SAVPQGAFEITDLNTASTGGDLDVKWSTKTGHRVRVFPVSIFRFVWG
ncbi:fimbria/pilus outer membrane usher protein, partial [Salmonella enterica subsp. enterica serovar Infantis]|nr:fimbria/pilus outer membrane usher protein [Salmonella enterica subsp. enterica serovar Infantis]